MIMQKLILILLLSIVGMINNTANANPLTYTIPDSPEQFYFEMNTWDELDWTEIEVEDDMPIGNWSIDFTWKTEEYFWESGSFHVLSPSGTTDVIVSNTQSGTYSISSEKFNDTFPTRGGILMLFEHPERFIKEAYCIVSKMSGRDSYNTIESHEITGCIPKQSMRVVSLLEEWLGINYEVKGSHLKHSELKLPLIAIREAVNNALFHRQYSIQGPIKIALFSNRLEIFSSGHFSGPFIP